MSNLTEREQWFIDRIGKIVYGSRPLCKCEKCRQSHKDGYLVTCHRSALHLAETEEQATAEDRPLHFCDTAEEAYHWHYENGTSILARAVAAQGIVALAKLILGQSKINL